LIPIIGGSLSALWNQWDTDRRFNRVEETLAELTKLLASGQYSLVAESLLDDDMQILETVLQRAQMAHTEEKRRLFARLIATCWTDAHDRPFDERMLFVNALSAFTENHIKALSILDDAGVNGAVSYSSLCVSVASSLPTEVEKNSLMVPILETLAAQFGFIRRAWGLNDPSYKGAALFSLNLSPEGIARKCNHVITPLGQRFMKSLKEK